MFQQWPGFHVEVIPRSIWQFRLQIQIVTVTSSHWNLRKMNSIGIFRSYLLPLWRSFFVCLTMLNSTVNILQWTSLWSLNLFQHAHYESWLILPFFDQVCLKNVSWCLFSNRVTSRLNSESSNARSHCPPLYPHVQDLHISWNSSGRMMSQFRLQVITKLSTKRPKNMTPKSCQAQNDTWKKEPFCVCFCTKKKPSQGPSQVQCLHHVEVDSTKATREDARKPEKDVLKNIFGCEITCISTLKYMCKYMHTTYIEKHIWYILITSIHVYIMSMYMYCMSHIPSIVLKSVWVQRWFAARAMEPDEQVCTFAYLGVVSNRSIYFET